MAATPPASATDGRPVSTRRCECLVILGKSGSGKSVTLRQLNGLDKPDAGSVEFAGANLSALDERELFPFRRRIGMLFQGGALFDSMNIFDNIAFQMREHTELPERMIRDLVMLLATAKLVSKIG